MYNVEYLIAHRTAQSDRSSRSSVMTRIAVITVALGVAAILLTLAVVSDLHNEAYEDIFPLIEGADALLVPGDISDRYHKQWKNGIAFLHDAASHLPTFYSLGNHEVKQEDYAKLKAALYQTGAEILINRHVKFGEVWIGGGYFSGAP